MMNRKAYTVLLVLLASVISLLLAACGGGGGTRQPVPSTGDEMTITPPIDETALPSGDYADTPEQATAVVSGQTVDGFIDSPDDVDYFRLELTEPSAIISTLTADSGLEIAVVDGNGNVLTTAVTASDATVGAATEKRTLWVRVKEVLESGQRVSEELKKRYKAAFKVIPVLKTINGAIDLVGATNSIREISSEIKQEVPNACAAPGEVSREQIRQKVLEKIDSIVISAAGTGGALFGGFVGSLVPVGVGGIVGGAVGGEIGLAVGEGLSSLVRPVIEPKIEGMINAILEELKTSSCLQEIKPLSVSVEQGGEVMIRLTDYIEDPAGGALTFAHGSLPTGFGVTTDGADWTIATQSTVTPDDYTITVTATNDANQSQDFPLQVTVTEEGEDLGLEWVRAQNVDCHIRYVSYSSSLSSSYRFVYLFSNARIGTYSGGCHERKVHGQGTWTYYYNYNDPNILDGSAVVEAVYKGGWRDGFAHGQGTRTAFLSNSGFLDHVYKGGWRDSLAHGQGTLTTYYEGGDLIEFVYEGGWRDGFPHGQGTRNDYWSNGQISLRLVGEWKDGDLWNGTQTYHNGAGALLSRYTCREGECIEK